MKLARIVFLIAGIYGILVLTPLYFLERTIGRETPPPITHPEFFYGFVGVGLAWQIVFLIIAQDPLRYRPMMIPSVLEKVSYGAALVVLLSQHRISISSFELGMADVIFAVLFIISFVKTHGISSASQVAG
jgi:hypothetical protein